MATPRINYSRQVVLAMLPIILLFQFIVNFAINEKNVEKSLAPPQLSSFVVKKEKKTGIFEWKCQDKCSCLPPITPQTNADKDFVLMHQSYKSSDPQSWHWGWKSQRQTWFDLHPTWHFIFWNDEQNILLANCTGYADVLDGRSGIQQADLSRLLYLNQYGGFYADMDYIALRDHRRLFKLDHKQVNVQQILLQGREDQVVGFEWGYARKRHHPLWAFCLNIARGQKGSAKRKGCPIWFTGPKFLNRCIKKYFKQQNKDLKHMVSYGKDDLMILEPTLIAPVRGDDFTSECGKWRNITLKDTNDESTWTEVWPKSLCLQNLNGIGAYAVTLYSHSWGDGLKC